MSEATPQGRPGGSSQAGGQVEPGGDSEPGEHVAAEGLPEAPPPDRDGVRRPLIERVGLFLVALVLAALFGGIAAALLAGGELFLGVMAAIGCAMTVWVGGLTLLRG